jgi:hypothetical protein
MKYNLDYYELYFLKMFVVKQDNENGKICKCMHVKKEKTRLHYMIWYTSTYGIMQQPWAYYKS